MASIHTRFLLLAAVLVGLAPGLAGTQPTTPFYVLDGPTKDAKLGAYVARVPDATGDGVDELVSGNHRFDGRGGIDSGRVVLFDGATGNVLWTVDGERAGGLLGHDVWGIGDLDGDGRGDVIASAYRFTFPGVPGKRNAGKAYVLSGLDGTVLWTANGENTADEFGYALASVPDLDNDGFQDVVIGAWLNDDGAYLAGKAYVFSGKKGTLIRTHLGLGRDHRLGAAVAGFRDLDGDGYGDYAVGAIKAGPGSEGQVYLFSGKSGGLIRTFTGEAPGDLFGRNVTVVPDLDGDTFDDLHIGAPQHDVGGIRSNAGRSYLISGRSGLLIRVLDGEKSLDQFGRFGAGVPDLDGDGRGDVVIGAPNHSGNGVLASGAAYLFSGATGTRLRKYVGEARYNMFGFALAGLNDVNGDGRGDVVVGAFQYRPNPTRMESYGRIYVYADGLTGPVTSVSVSAGGKVPLRIDTGSATPGRPYLVVASLGGASPGFEVKGLHVPLNFDPVTIISWAMANSAILVNTFGRTDAQGQATASFAPPPGLLAGLAGQRLTFVAALVDRLDLVSNPLAVTLTP